MIVRQSARMDERPALARLGDAAVVAYETASAPFVVHADSIERNVDCVNGRIVMRHQSVLFTGSIPNNKAQRYIIFAPLSFFIVVLQYI